MRATLPRRTGAQLTQRPSMRGLTKRATPVLLAAVLLAGVGAATNAEAAPPNQTITVTVHAPAVATYDNAFTVTASSDSGLQVSYSSSGVCSNVGPTFRMTGGAGTCLVKYDQAGDATYNAAPQVVESVTAQKAEQTISFDPLDDATFEDPD